MTVEDRDLTLLDDAAHAVELPRESDSLDEENTLKKDFVRRVQDALAEDDQETVYALVEPLHPADIADLFELIEVEERPVLAKAISDLMGSEVFAELNDHVRELLVESLPAEAIADIAEQLDTDDAVAMLEDLGHAVSEAILAAVADKDREVGRRRLEPVVGAEFGVGGFFGCRLPDIEAAGTVDGAPR